MQCLPSTGQWVGSLIGRDLNLLSTQDNITCGVVLLRSLTPVSYTRLDVYKRQSPPRWPAPAPSSRPPAP